jgi:hypothetical protein
LEEKNFPTFKELNEYTLNVYSIEEFKNMELVLLKILDYELSIINSYHFLDLYLHILEEGEEYNDLCKKLLIEASQNVEKVKNLLPSFIAMRVICTVNSRKNKKIWKNEYCYLSNFNEKEIINELY